MENQSVSQLTSFADHLDEQYGKLGTPVREEFEEGFESFRLIAAVQDTLDKPDNL